MISIVNRDSRSIFGSPAGCYHSFQLIEQSRINGVDGLHERRDRCMRCRTE
jgi:hypothetical protein